MFQKILGRREEERGEEENKNPDVVDRMLEEKYGMPFDEFYYIVESLETHRLVEAGFDWDEIYHDFGKWIEAARKLGKLRGAEERMWDRVF